MIVPTERQGTQAQQPVKCDACGTLHPLAELVHEEPIKAGVWETVMVCPACGERKHIYYMTDALRALRQKLQATLAEYQAAKSQAGWDRYQVAKQVFQRHFDRVQARWKRKLGETREGEDG